MCPLTGPPAVTDAGGVNCFDFPRRLVYPAVLKFPGKPFLAKKFGGWSSKENPMPRKDAYWAEGEPALAREPKPGYNKGMIRGEWGRA
jgi:hypothetical protein